MRRCRTSSTSDDERNDFARRANVPRPASLISTPNQRQHPVYPASARGAYALSSRNVRRDAMDALATQDERRVKRTAKSCGPDAPTLASSVAEVSARRRWQQSPVTGESTKETVKPLRREGRIASAEPVCSCAFLRCTVCTRDRGCSAHPVFPAPSSSRIASALTF